MEPETRYAKSGALRIAYQLTGAGPDLVMIPVLLWFYTVHGRFPAGRGEIPDQASPGPRCRAQNSPAVSSAARV